MRVMLSHLFHVPYQLFDTRLDYRWVDLRTSKNQLMFKAQTAFVAALREFLLKKDFIEIHTPKLIGAASESGADVFKVEYFDRFAYLAQSPQFYKQMAMAAGFERIFECGPVFRAEKSFTNKHTPPRSATSRKLLLFIKKLNAKTVAAFGGLAVS